MNKASKGNQTLNDIYCAGRQVARDAAKFGRKGVEYMVATTGRHPRAAVYGTIGAILGAPLGPAGSVVMAGAGAVLGRRAERKRWTIDVTDYSEEPANSKSEKSGNAPFM